MPPSIKAYTPAGALVADVTAKIKYQTLGADKVGDVRAPGGVLQPREDGAASLVLAGDVDPAALAEGLIYRVNDGTTDVLGFVPNTKERVALDGPGVTEVAVSGPGVRWLLHKGQIYPLNTGDFPGQSTTRHLGWMSVDYDDTGWSAPVSFGTFQSGPWVTARPENWPAPFAEYLGISLDPMAAGDFGARTTFTLTEDTDVILTAAGDDEYRVWIDDAEVSELSTIGGGPFQWKRWQQRPMRLYAGTHTVAIQVRNLARPAGLESMNYGWFIFALSPAGSNGNLRAGNQKWNVYHDHSAGTFTLTGAFGETTAAIAFDANAAAVQSALEALATVGTGNVTVSGSGSVSSPWVVEFGGDLASTYVPLSIDGSGLTGGTGAEADEIQRGKTAGSVLKSEVDGWKVKDFSTGVPGMTPGKMLRVCLEAIQARGASDLDHVTLGCTDTLDSNGDPWTVELNIPVSLPADLHRLAVLLEEHGVPVEMAPDLTLNAWNTRGTDRTSGPGAVSILAHSAGVKNLRASKDETVVENVLRLRTDEGWTEITHAASVTARGRWESGLSLDGYASADQAEPVTTPLLDDLATPPRVTTCDIPSEAAVVPMREFFPADIVTASAFAADGFDEIPMRAVGFRWRLEETSLVWTVELID